MKITVYGGDNCQKCKVLLENTKSMVSEIGIDAQIVYEKDLELMISKGILSIPALEINGKIVSVGKVPKPKELKKYLME